MVSLLACLTLFTVPEISVVHGEEANTIILPGNAECLEFMGISEIESLVKHRVSTSMDFNEHEKHTDDIEGKIHDTYSICDGFCKSILLHKNEHHLSHRMHASVDRLKRERACIVLNGATDKDASGECQTGWIEDYCNKRMCSAFSEACDLIMQREICVATMTQTSHPVSLDCFIHMHAYQDLIRKLTPEKVRRKVNGAGLRAYNTEVMRQKAHCKNIGIPEHECSFDWAFEVEMRSHLKGWYGNRAYSACIRVNEKSPPWMSPKLDCAQCIRGELTDQQACVNTIVARQLRINYHKIRFLELLDLYHREWGHNIGAYEWILAKTNVQSNTGQLPKCFEHFFAAPGAHDDEDVDSGDAADDARGHRERTMPELRCFECLATMLAENLSIDQGSWFREHVALKLFNVFFSSENVDALSMTSDVSIGEIYDVVEQVKCDVYRERAEETLQNIVRNIDGDDDDKSAETRNRVDGDVNDDLMANFLTFIEMLGKEVQRIVPFSYEDDFSRQVLYFTHRFLAQAMKFDRPRPGVGDVHILLLVAAKSLREFESRVADIKSEFDHEMTLSGDDKNAQDDAKKKNILECEVAFFDKFAQGRGLVRAARKLVTLNNDAQADAISKAPLQFVMEKVKNCVPEDTDVSSKEYKEMFKAILSEDGLASRIEKGTLKAAPVASDGSSTKESSTNEGRASTNIEGFSNLNDHLRTHIFAIAKARLLDVLDEILKQLSKDYSRSKQRAKLSPTAHLDPRADDPTTNEVAANKVLREEEAREDMRKRLVGYQFEWHEYLRDSEKWAFGFFSELNDAGLAYRRLEMQRVRHLCKVFRIDPDVTYFPVDDADSDSREAAHNSARYDALSGNYDKQECSMQHILARQYALRGFLEYDAGTRHVNPPKKLSSERYRIWPTNAISDDAEAVALQDPVKEEVSDALKALDKASEEEENDNVNAKT